jgi:hypothetical protein
MARHEPSNSIARVAETFAQSGNGHMLIPIESPHEFWVRFIAASSMPCDTSKSRPVRNGMRCAVPQFTDLDIRHPGTTHADDVIVCQRDTMPAIVSYGCRGKVIDDPLHGQCLIRRRRSYLLNECRNRRASGNSQSCDFLPRRFSRRDVNPVGDAKNIKMAAGCFDQRHVGIRDNKRPVSRIHMAFAVEESLEPTFRKLVAIHRSIVSDTCARRTILLKVTKT